MWKLYFTSIALLITTYLFYLKKYWLLTIRML